MDKGSEDQTTTPSNPANKRPELTEFEESFFDNMQNYGGDPKKLNFTCAVDYFLWLQKQKEEQQELAGNQEEPAEE